MSDLASDLLHGAGAIAEEVFGTRSEKARRRIYHLHQKRRLPTWKEGPEIMSTKSAIREHYSDKQAAAVAKVNTTNT
jgi:hypothetical protein